MAGKGFKNPNIWKALMVRDIVRRAEAMILRRERCVKKRVGEISNTAQEQTWRVSLDERATNKRTCRRNIVIRGTLGWSPGSGSENVAWGSCWRQRDVRLLLANLTSKFCSRVDQSSRCTWCIRFLRASPFPAQSRLLFSWFSLWVETSFKFCLLSSFKLLYITI